MEDQRISEAITSILDHVQYARRTWGGVRAPLSLLSLLFFDELFDTGTLLHPCLTFCRLSKHINVAYDASICNVNPHSA